VKLDEKAIK